MGSIAVGNIIQLDFPTVTDPTTGAAVRRLSPDCGDTIAPYFTQSLVSADGGTALVTSSCTGTTQLHAIDLEAARMVQLSHENGVGFHTPVLDAHRRIAYYWAGRLLRRVDLESLRGEALYEVPQGFSGGILSLDNTGRHLAFAYAETVQTSTATDRIYSEMQEHFYRRPSCVVMRFDTETGRPEAVWGERNWISHVAISPVDPDIVLFCHEGPWNRVHRMWVVRVSTGECRPLLNRANHTEKDGHEFFTASGRVITQYARRSTSTSDDWEEFNLVINPDGGGEERYRLGRRRPGHVQAAHADETLIVGDAAYPDGDIDTWGAAYMALIRHRPDGGTRVRPLCRHDTSWKTQRSHPHPFFAPDDRSVFFNSDRGGNANLYQVADLERFLP